MRCAQLSGRCGDLRETFEGLGEFVRREDAGGSDGLRVSLAGGDLLRQQTPVEGEAALPLLEGAVEGLAEAAGPHFGGLVRHLFRLSVGDEEIQILNVASTALSSTSVRSFD